jgi:hypothetical protein
MSCHDQLSYSCRPFIMAAVISSISLLVLRRAASVPPLSTRCSALPSSTALTLEFYLEQIITRIADYPINRIHELLPWNLTPIHN